ALDERPDDVRDEKQLPGAEDERPDRREPVQGPEEGQLPEGAVVVDAPRHPQEAEEVHREEDDVEADDREAEMPTGDALAVHPFRHPREPEVEAREGPEDRAAEQEVMEGRDDPVGVLEGIVEGDWRVER